MNFNRRRGEEPEINLIPLIDVLLVVIIFLILTTTYTRYAGLEINLPTADAETQTEAKKNQIDVAITANGQIMVNEEEVLDSDEHALIDALTRAADGRKDPTVIISADAKTAHQRVIDVMQAAQNAGFPHLSFTTMKPPAATE